MSQRSIARHGFAWLELLLALAMLALVIQLFPSLWILVDFRNWSRGTWFVINGAVILVLVAIRFGPALIDDWRRRRARLTDERAKARKVQAHKAEREAIERIRRGRRRRIY